MSGRHICVVPECSVVDVQLYGKGLEDRDLPGILAHLQQHFFSGHGRYARDSTFGVRAQHTLVNKVVYAATHAEGYKLCLSRNPGVTDFGIVNHLAPFLRQDGRSCLVDVSFLADRHHPHCMILDLSETSIGDAALEARRRLSLPSFGARSLGTVAPDVRWSLVSGHVT